MVNLKQILGGLIYLTSCYNIYSESTWKNKPINALLIYTYTIIYWLELCGIM